MDFRLKCNTTLLALHGKLHQLRRMAIYDEFCQKDSAVVLLATDVASRGLGEYFFKVINLFWPFLDAQRNQAHIYRYLRSP